MGSFKTNTILLFKRICLLHLPPGERIAAYALLISILTMIFGFVQFSNQNTYADKQLMLAVNTTKLAYRPFVMIRTENSPESDPLGIILSNDGNGPALLYCVDVYYKNNLIDLGNLEAILGPERFWKEGTSYSRQQIYNYTALKNGDRLPLLTVKREIFENSRYQLTRFLENVSVVALYTSITNDTAICCYNIEGLSTVQTAKYPSALIESVKKGLLPTMSFQ